eukprot:3354904-Ditylum_brightwellii.AAC.1
MVGSDRINYPHDVSTPTADAITAKCVINSTISTPGAKFMCLDIKNFYLGTPMDWYEYMWLPVEIIPEEIMNILANKLLTERLATKGYMPCCHAP